MELLLWMMMSVKSHEMGHEKRPGQAAPARQCRVCTFCIASMYYSTGDYANFIIDKLSFLRHIKLKLSFLHLKSKLTLS